MSESAQAALANAPVSPSVQPLAGTEGSTRWQALGDWTVLSLRDGIEALQHRVSQAGGATVAWDLLPMGRMDTAGAMILWQGWGARRPAELACRPEHEALFRQIARPAAPAPQPARGVYGLRWLIAGVNGFIEHAVDVLALAGRLVMDLRVLMRHPELIAWREISANLYRTGARALPITALVGSLVGLTLAYLMTRQLQNYGAEVFIVNILGLAILRELGPLLAAIIVAGRSGASMTAQLGVMRVTQELDALSVMGVSHTLRLVMPKVVGLALAMPLVVLWTTAMMLLGGMVAGWVQLGLEPMQFLERLPQVVQPANLWLGWAKAVVFGALIALLACHFGLRVAPNTESLGDGVTQSVVTAITVVIVVDAVFAIIFTDIGN